MSEDLNTCINGHNFVAIDVTPRFAPTASAIGGSIGMSGNPMNPQYKIFCTRCGEVRELK